MYVGLDLCAKVWFQKSDESSEKTADGSIYTFF